MMTEDLPYFIAKFKIKCLPASWLSIAFSDTDVMLQFCLPNNATNNTPTENLKQKFFKAHHPVLQYK